jgi:hypothetical protein
VRTHTIRYCLTIDPADRPRFSFDGLRFQVEWALTNWLIPLSSFGVFSEVRLQNVSCSDETYNLRVEVGPETEFADLGAYQLEGNHGAHFFSRVKLNSRFLWHNVPIQDFSGLFNGSDWKNYLRSSLRRTEWSLSDFSLYVHADYDTLFWSTAKLLLHEVGHSFGLCDTIATQRAINCDPAYLTESSNHSVMSDSTYMSLTKDDREGIRALFRRFMN